MTYEECVIWKFQDHYKRKILPKLSESLATQGLDSTAGLSRQIIRVILEDEYVWSCIKEDYKKSFRTIKQSFELIIKEIDSVAIKCEKECDGLGLQSNGKGG